MSPEAQGDKLTNFERAFSGGTAGCRRTCDCGREFYDAENSYSWEDGEIEALEKDPNATALDHSCGDIALEGREYVNACECWHKRAEHIMAFIDSHAHQIADYLNREKDRKTKEAEAMPSVPDLHVA